MPLVPDRPCQKDPVVSTSLRKPGGQSLRQPGRKYLVLHPLDVIGYAMKCNGVPGIVIHGEGSARVTIARLADRTGIDQVLGRCSQHKPELLGPLRRFVSRCEGPFVLFNVVNPVRALNICMPKER